MSVTSSAVLRPSPPRHPAKNAECYQGSRPLRPVGNASCTNEDTWNCKYCRKTESCDALKDSRNFGTPAPVERDERAEFVAWCADIGYTLKHYEHGNGFKPGYGSELFSAWQARAALECKPSPLVNQLQADMTQRDERVDDLETRLAAQTELLKQLYGPLMEAAMEYDDKFETLAEEVAELIKIEDAAAQESAEADHIPTITIPPGLGNYDGSDNGVD